MRAALALCAFVAWGMAPAHAASYSFITSNNVGTSYSLVVAPGITRVGFQASGGLAAVGGSVVGSGQFGGAGGKGATYTGIMNVASGATISGKVGANAIGGLVCPASGFPTGWSDGGQTLCSGSQGAAGAGGASSSILVNGVGFVQSGGGGGGQMGNASGAGLAGGDATAVLGSANCAAVDDGGTGGPVVGGGSVYGNGGGGGGGFVAGAGGTGRTTGVPGTAAVGGTSCIRNTAGSFAAAPAHSLISGAFVAMGWPDLIKSMSPGTIAAGGTTTLTLFVLNGMPASSFETVGFTDNLPAGLRVAASPTVTVSGAGCVNPAAALAGVSAVPGATSITLSNMAVTGLESCVVTIKLTNAPGQYNPSCSGNPAAFTNAAANITAQVNIATTAVGPSCVVVTPPASLDTVKTLAAINGAAATAGAGVKAGDILDYLLSVTNTGGASGATQLQESVPAGTSFSAAAPSTGWSCADGAPALTACSQTLTASAGGTATAHFSVVVNANTTGMTQVANTVASSVGGCSGCSVADPLLPTLRVAKRSVGGVGSFGFAATGATPVNETLVTAADGVTVTSPTLHLGSIGTAAGIDETGGAFGYSTAASCTDANSAATGNTTPITSAVASIAIPGASMKAGAAYTCLFTNTRVVASLSVVVAASPDPVQSGRAVVFTLTVNNAGPAAAHGAVLRDKPGAGIDCAPDPDLPVAPTCVASGGAACPTAAALTAAALTGTSGVPIPVLPGGGRAVVTLTCMATANGK